MYSRFLREVALAGLPSRPGPADAIANSQLESLPEPAQRYARFMGVVGRSQDWSFRLSFTGRFRTRPRQPWMDCQTWQYNNRLAMARIFHIRIRFGGILPVIGRDTYVRGRGRMLIRFLDLFTIGDGTGEEYDISELVTYLNDAVMIAPTMLFAPYITWSAVDDDSFDVSLTDDGRTVTARVMVDEQGAPRDFSTMDRFCYNPDAPKQLVRARWTTPIAGWDLIDGRRLPDHRPSRMAPAARAVCLCRVSAGPWISGLQCATRHLSLARCQVVTSRDETGSRPGLGRGIQSKRGIKAFGL